MTTSEIIAAVKQLEKYGELADIRKALDERWDAVKAEFMAQAEAMGLACHDDNGKPKRKRRNSHKEAD